MMIFNLLIVMNLLDRYAKKNHDDFNLLIMTTLLKCNCIVGRIMTKLIKHRRVLGLEARTHNFISMIETKESSYS
jgi:hypothetical protein